MPTVGTRMRILAALMLLAALTRGLIAFNGGLWRDEALFLSIVRMSSWREIVDVLHFHESHPPLFYGVMRGWLLLVGDTDSRALVLPILLGVTLVPVMFFAAARLYSQRTGMIAAALTVIVPALNEYSAEARPYSLLPLLVLLSCALLVLAMKRPMPRLWFLYVVTAVALVYTHNWAWLIIAGHAMAVAIVIVRGRSHRKTVALRSSVAFASVGLAYMPWVLALAYQLGHAGHPPRSVDRPSALLMLVPNGFARAIQSTLLPPVHALQVLSWFTVVALTVLIFVFSRRLVYAMTGGRQESSDQQGESAEARRVDTATATCVFLTVPIVATAGAALASLHTDMLQPRCFVMLAPLLVMLLADRIDRLFQSTRPGSNPRRLVIALVVLLIVDYAVRLNFLITTSRSNADSIASAVNRNTKPTDLVITGREWIATSFNHYYPAPNQQIDFPTFGRQNSGNFGDVWVRLADPRALARVNSEILAARNAGRRVWLIIDSRNLDSASAAERREASQPGAYVALASVRASQIEQRLMQQYGPPDEVSAGGHGASRYETLHAFLFSPH